MARFLVECKCGFRSEASLSGWHDISTWLLFLAAILPSGDLVAKTLHRDKPPLDQVSSDKFEQMDWIEKNATSIIKLEFGNDAVLDGPTSEGIVCPNCKNDSAKSSAC